MAHSTLAVLPVWSIIVKVYVLPSCSSSKWHIEQEEEKQFFLYHFWNKQFSLLTQTPLYSTGSLLSLEASENTVPVSFLWILARMKKAKARKITSMKSFHSGYKHVLNIHILILYLCSNSYVHTVLLICILLQEDTLQS